MEPIAVIGLALRFSGDAVTEKDFWKVMMEKRCTMTEWPESRINIDSFHCKHNASKSLVRATNSTESEFRDN
jgi:acyl transferase domain-containing protein